MQSHVSTFGTVSIIIFSDQPCLDRSQVVRATTSQLRCSQRRGVVFFVGFAIFEVLPRFVYLSGKALLQLFVSGNLQYSTFTVIIMASTLLDRLSMMVFPVVLQIMCGTAFQFAENLLYKREIYSFVSSNVWTGVRW